MKKFGIFCAVVTMALCFFVTGCSTFKDPTFVGQMTGKTLYLTYAKVAENQSDEFKTKVSELWTEVNKVNDASDLYAVNRSLNEKFEAVLADKKLSDADKQVLTAVKNDVCGKIDEVLNTKFESNEDGIKFLVGVRSGVNSMIEANKKK